MLKTEPVKKLEVVCLIVRKIESSNFDMPVRTVFYVMPLTYTIEGKESEEWSLVLTESLCNDYYDERNIKRLVKVMLRNETMGVAFEAPTPTQDYKPNDFPYLTITKGKVKQLKKAEIESVLRGQTCIGIFEYNVQNQEFGIDNKRTV